MGSLDETDASRMLSEMDPDDAAELVSELDYDKAEKLLRLMGVQEQRAIRQLLGYRESTAGRIMTSEVATVGEGATVADAVEMLRGLDDDFEEVRYVYLVDEAGKLAGVVPLRGLIVSAPETPLSELATVDLITASPEDDQEAVAENIAKYNLLAMPVVADDGRLLGIVTVDDALDVMEEEHAEDLRVAGGSADGEASEHGGELVWLLRRNVWFFLWLVVVAVGALATGGLIPLVEVLLACAALPIALVLADDSVSYVTNFFLENDPDDEDAPSMVGFTFKGLLLGVALGALDVLLAMALTNVIFAGSPTGPVSGALTAGFLGAAVAIFVSFASSPVYLAILRRREERNQETSGFALSVVAMLVTVAVFGVTLVALAGPLGMLA